MGFLHILFFLFFWRRGCVRSKGLSLQSKIFLMTMLVAFVVMGISLFFKMKNH